MKDEKFRDEFRSKLEKLHVEYASKCPEHVEKVFALVCEAADKNII